MATSILPVLRTIYTCEGYTPLVGGRVDLAGVFVSLSVPRFPHVFPAFCAFAQMAGGAGFLSFHFDIVYANSYRLIYSTPARTVTFPNRIVTVQLAHTIQNLRLDNPGIYLVELFCNNQFVGDTAIRVS